MSGASEKKDNQTSNEKTDKQLEGLRASPRRIRTQYMREQMIAQMGAMLDQGATIDQICATLKISTSTFYKWHDLIAEQERKRIDVRFEKEVLVNLRNAYNMMSRTINVLSTIENNAENPIIDRIEAGKLKNQLGIARIRLLREGTRAVMKDLPAATKQSLQQFGTPLTSTETPPPLPRLQNLEEVKTGYEAADTIEFSQEDKDATN